MVLLLVGNKVDLEDERQVDRGAALRIAESKNIALMETSAKTGVGVRRVFEEIAKGEQETQDGRRIGFLQSLAQRSMSETEHHPSTSEIGAEQKRQTPL